MKNATNLKKKIILSAMLFTLSTGIAAGAVRAWVYAMGVSSGSDRDTTDSDAYNNAVMNANGSCPGVIEDQNYIKTGDTCANLGDTDNPAWMCTVAVKAMCRMGR